MTEEKREAVARESERRPAGAKVGPYGDELYSKGLSYELRFFRRQVLERYVNDPRYLVEESSAGGSLTIKSEFDSDARTPDADKVFVQHFGIAYTPDGTHVVAVPLRYLGYLTCEHQMYWSSYELQEDIRVDEDYFRQAFQGEFTDRVSIFDAFLQELSEINSLCDMIGWPHLFRETFEGQNVPALGWMTKPTSRALEEFIHTLDKLLSENMNREFFAAGGIALTEEIKRKDGTVEVRDKGTIILLNCFLERYMRPDEPETVERLIAALREIRSSRQKPAHQVTSNHYEGELVQQQREMMRRAYSAIRDLRLIFMLHPAASDYEPPEWLQTGRIM